VPETVGSLVAFLFFVTPGLTFELLRERSRPQRQHTAFRETAIVVIGSVAFSSIAVASLAVVRSIWPGWMPDPHALAADPGDYAAEHIGVVTRALAIEVGVATMLAFAWHRVLCRVRPGGQMSANPAWFEVTDGNANPRRDRVLAFVELEDGSAMRGFIKGYDFAPDQTLRTLVLGGDQQVPLRSRRVGAETTSDLDGSWAYSVIPGVRIKSATVALLARSRSQSGVALSRWRRALGRIGQKLVAASNR
jgi:hypothetical protein